MGVEVAKCSCGRSPTGNCIGWHKLSEAEYQLRKQAYEEAKKDRKDGRNV